MDAPDAFPGSRGLKSRPLRRGGRNRNRNVVDGPLTTFPNVVDGPLTTFL
jgi:hypothetical protein